MEEEKQQDGSSKKRMAKEGKDILAKLKSGEGSAVKKIKQNIKLSDKYSTENFDLITWFLVS